MGALNPKALAACAHHLEESGIRLDRLHGSPALRQLAAARLARQNMALSLAEAVVEVIAGKYAPEEEAG